MYFFAMQLNEFKRQELSGNSELLGITFEISFFPFCEFQSDIMCLQIIDPSL